MASLRDIKTKIKGVNKTRQITRAMNMVAAAKLRGVQAKTLNFRPYAEKFTDVLSRLCQGLQTNAHPLLSQHEEVKAVALILLTAERGMCGAFNNNLIAEASKFIKKQTAQGRKVRIYCIGGKGRNFFSKNFPQHYQGGKSGDLGEMNFDAASKIAYFAVKDFINREIEEAYLIYSNYRSMSSQLPLIKKLLPITPPPQAAKTKNQHVDYIFEPSAAALIGAILPLFINIQVYQGLLETATGEQAARMVAMDNATKNCKEIIDNLTTLFNKARQSAITTELIDIVSGADAVSA